MTYYTDGIDNDYRNNASATLNPAPSVLCLFINYYFPCICTRLSSSRPPNLRTLCFSCTQRANLVPPTARVYHLLTPVGPARPSRPAGICCTDRSAIDPSPATGLSRTTPYCPHRAVTQNRRIAVPSRVRTLTVSFRPVRLLSTALNKQYI